MVPEKHVYAYTYTTKKKTFYKQENNVVFLFRATCFVARHADRIRIHQKEYLIEGYQGADDNNGEQIIMNLPTPETPPSISHVRTIFDNIYAC